MKNKAVRNWVIDLLAIIFGSLTYAATINFFLVPYQLAPGGAGGLATMINFLTGFPIGIMILLINIPLFVLGRKLLGRKFFIKSLISTLLISVFADVFSFLPKIGNNTLLASIFSGLMMGVGFGFMFMRGATSGGSDLLARILKVRLTHISMGNLILIIDTVVISASAIAFRNIESAFYAAISLYVSSRVVDTMLDGVNYAKLLYIISDHYEEIAERFGAELDRGVTVLDAKGFYTGMERKMLLIAVRRHQIYFAKQIVRETDPKAFMIFTDATEVFGEGFTQEHLQ